LANSWLSDCNLTGEVRHPGLSISEEARFGRNPAVRYHVARHNGLAVSHGSPFKETQVMTPTTPTIGRSRDIGFLLWALCCFAFGAVTFAAETRRFAQDSEPPADPTHRLFGRGEFRLDVTEPLELPEKFQPTHPRSTTVQQRIDAMAWFMKGRFLEQREEFKAALDAYEQAAKLDPNAVEIYRSLIPLAFGLNDPDKALKYAMQAVELSPDDYLLLQRVGIHLATKDRVVEGLRLLEQASQSKKLDRLSGQYVSIMRDLAFLYLITSQVDKAADSFEVVFDAKNNPEKFHLDYQMKSELEKHPRTSYESIGQVFLDAKRPDRAIVALERAAQAKKTKPGNISFSLAQAYLMTERPDQAMEHLQIYFDAQLQSKGKSAYQLLAEILKAQKKSEDLIPRLEQLAEKDQHNQTLQFFLARQYVEANRFEDAEARLKKTLEREKSIDGYLGLAALYRRQNRPAELLQALSQAFSRESELEKAAEDLEQELQAINADEKLVAGLLEVGGKQIDGDSPQLDFAGSVLLAKIAAQSKQYDAAERFYRFGIKLRRDRSANLYDELARMMLEARRFAEAVKVIDDAIAEPALKNNRAAFWFLQTQAREMAGDTDGALAAVAEGRKLAGEDNPLFQFQEAWIHYHAHRWEQAIPLLEKFIAKYPGHRLSRQCQFSLSNIYVQQGDLRKGEEILEKVLAEAPDDPSVNNDLGYLYADQGKNLEKAREMIAKALKAEPDNAAYQDSMGWVLFKLGKPAEAIPFLEKAVESPRGGDATIFDHLGDCYQALGQKEKAIENWKKALKDAKEDKHPDQKLIEKIQEKLKGK
jgi:tetratricopeptide (TPR) repeat protein